MIRINLIPREVYVEEVRRQFRMGGISLAVLIGLVLLGGIGHRFVKAKKLENSLVIAKGELRKYQAIVDKVNAVEQKRNQLRARRDVIRQLLIGRLIYPKFFEDFMSLMPAEVWVKSLSTSLDQNGVIAISISAQSLSNFAIADWISNLQTSPLCSEVNLGAISQSGTTLAFSIRFKYLRKDA